GIDQLERPVHLGGGALDDSQRADQRPRHPLGADPEVLDRALGLRAPIAIGRHLDRAEGVGLGPGARSGALAGRDPALPFLRKRSRRATSAPAPPLSAGGFGGSADFSDAGAAASGLAGTLVLRSWGVPRFSFGGFSASAWTSSSSSWFAASGSTSNC